MKSRKDIQKLMQEAAVEIEKAINKGREAAIEGMGISAQDNTSKMDEFDMYCKYYHYFMGLHFIKLTMPPVLFKNHTTEE